MKRLVIVVISKTPHPDIENVWRGKGYSIVWRVNNITVDPENSLRRVSEVANERNLAMKEALETFPDTTDVFMLDSYYADQYKACERLISDYQNCVEKLILSATIWNKQRTRIYQVLAPRVVWHDSWGFPDCRFMPFGWKPSEDKVVWGNGAKRPMPEFYRVSCVGSAYIFPIEAYQKTPYRPCEDLSRTEHYYLCHDSGLVCYVDFNASLWKTLEPYPLIKCIRVSLGYWKTRLLTTARRIGVGG